MYIVFDTETNGLPKWWNRPIDEIDNYPRIAQIAWKVLNKDFKEIKSEVHYIKPDGWKIPNEQFFIENGYTTEMLSEKGKPIGLVLSRFLDDINEYGEYLIAHNIKFDYPVLNCELLRLKADMQPPKMICTMLESQKIFGHSRWRKLIDLHYDLFNEGFENAHDAMADVDACSRIFTELEPYIEKDSTNYFNLQHEI